MSLSIPYSFRQLQEIERSIRIDGECPVKFAYFGVGADRYQIVSSHPKYSLERVESTLLKNRAVNFIHAMDNPSHLNVIDLGCGDGNKALVLLEELIRLGLSVRYCAVDISDNMLRKAIGTVKSKWPSVRTMQETLDFERVSFREITDSMRTRQYPVNLVLFLGHTLGNASNRRRALSHIHDSMGSNDFCLIGVELYDEQLIHKLKDEYNFDEMFDLVFTTLEYLGVPRKIGHLQEPLFNRHSKEVELAFLITRPWSYDGMNIALSFEPEQRVVLARSYKFEVESLGQELSQERLRVVTPESDPEKKFSLQLCGLGLR